MSEPPGTQLQLSGEQNPESLLNPVKSQEEAFHDCTLCSGQLRAGPPLSSLAECSQGGRGGAGEGEPGPLPTPSPARARSWFLLSDQPQPVPVAGGAPGFGVKRLGFKSGSRTCFGNWLM